MFKTLFKEKGKRNREKLKNRKANFLMKLAVQQIACKVNIKEAMLLRNLRTVSRRVRGKINRRSCAGLKRV